MTVYRYRQYRAALKAAAFTGKYMPYEWGNLPPRLPFTWAAYAEMFREFSSELANVVNSLTRYTHQLKAWRDVVDSLDDNGKINVAVDFIEPLGTLALNLPYVIRSRFIFAAAHLCHQAGRTKVEGWKDDLPLDDEIYFLQADKAGKSWKQYGKFKLRLERVGDKTYQARTHDFRNRYNHRFSPRIVIGQTGLVTRRVNPTSKAVSYGFGGIGPLTLPLVVELLEQQCKYCYAAFEAFQKLVQEHEAAITPAVAAELSAMDSAIKERQKLNKPQESGSN
jgi:hypothetical protein